MQVSLKQLHLEATQLVKRLDDVLSSMLDLTSTDGSYDNPDLYVAGLLRGVRATLDQCVTNRDSDELEELGEWSSDDLLLWLQPIVAAYVNTNTELDGKFYGVIFRHKDHSLVDPRDSIVFVARDKVVGPMLNFYFVKAEELGASPQQLAGIVDLKERVARRQAEIPDQMKVPDLEPGELFRLPTTPTDPEHAS